MPEGLSENDVDITISCRDGRQLTLSVDPARNMRETAVIIVDERGNMHTAYVPTEALIRALLRVKSVVEGD